MSLSTQTPTIVVLKEGTDISQGKSQILNSISACSALQDILKPTLGPFGLDVLIKKDDGTVTITNDGATILKLLDVVHPSAKLMVEIAKSQDSEVGDGTTSVVILASEILNEFKTFVEDGVSPHILNKGLIKACELSIEKINELAVDIINYEKEEFYELLQHCAATAMSSKLIHNNSSFFSKMIVDAVLSLDQNDFNEKLIGFKSVLGGSMEDSFFVDGVSFKKTFSYAGFEQQPKVLKNPKILCLNIELELKAEKDNAEVRVTNVTEYQKIVDAEWQLIFNKLDSICALGANIILSKLPIGDLATQYFADRDIFCSGRVSNEDMNRVVNAVGATLQTTCSDLQTKDLGTCDLFEEIQIGLERFNVFKGCVQSKTCTLILRGAADQIISEVERSLHDALMIVKRTLTQKKIVAGGGAIEMELSKYLRDYSKEQTGKQQIIFNAYARSLEIIPRQLCENAGMDSIEVLNKLRKAHNKNEIWYGIDLKNETIANNLLNYIWEPALIKLNAIKSATEAVISILSIDEIIKSENQDITNARGQASY